MPRKGAAPKQPEIGERKSTEGSVRALIRALQILKRFDSEHPSWSLAELSRSVELHKATTRRLVKTLESEGFLQPDRDSGEFRLGSALLPLTYLARSQDHLVRVAHPHLERLAEASGETATLSIWTEGGILLIDHVMTNHYFKPALTLGRTSSEYGTTHSKILLAFGTPDRLARMSLGDSGRSITLAEVEKIHDELKSVRDSGIAFDTERFAGVSAVAVPVHDSSAEVVASLSLVIPTDRYTKERRAVFASLVREAGVNLSRDLGFRGPVGALAGTK